MLSRTRREAIIFAHPFTLEGWTAPLPAGDYTVETDEELIEGLSFPAYRRVATTLIAAGDARGVLAGVVQVDPRALAEAKRADMTRVKALSDAARPAVFAPGSGQPKLLAPRPGGAPDA
jgi:hypothetical protein